jgi:hypothetical protein
MLVAIAFTHDNLRYRQTVSQGAGRKYRSRRSAVVYCRHPHHRWNFCPCVACKILSSVNSRKLRHRLNNNMWLQAYWSHRHKSGGLKDFGAGGFHLPDFSDKIFVSSPFCSDTTSTIRWLPTKVVTYLSLVTLMWTDWLNTGGEYREVRWMGRGKWRQRPMGLLPFLALSVHKGSWLGSVVCWYELYVTLVVICCLLLCVWMFTIRHGVCL